MAQEHGDSGSGKHGKTGQNTVNNGCKTVVNSSCTVQFYYKFSKFTTFLSQIDTHLTVNVSIFTVVFKTGSFASMCRFEGT